MVKNSKSSIYFSLVVTLAVIIGVFIGKHIPSVLPAGKSTGVFASSGSGKIGYLLRMIEEDYVDPVNLDSISDQTVEMLLSKLDPHSVYMPPVDLEAFNEDMEGHFDGIGIEFNVIRDTVVVVHVISGGPASQVGMRDGDRIVKVEKEVVAGVGMSSDSVVKKLRGKKGTRVDVTVYRPREKKSVDFSLVRGPIPVYSVEQSVMLDKNTGYIKVNRFIDNTHRDFLRALKTLKAQGMRELLLDLRGNHGGYLDEAVKIADEFLPSGDLITYTAGTHRKRENYKAKGGGAFEEGRLAILIDEESASASEILAGAIQDHDRGVIVGRRSFGKGLVQEVKKLPDGSAVRLTVARYFTPSGRSIQRPYKEGVEAYYQAYYEHQFNDSDSLPGTDTLKYFTDKGRVVYGGGGIAPDIRVGWDTLGYTAFTGKLWQESVLLDFAFNFADANRDAKRVPAGLDGLILNGVLRTAREKNIITPVLSATEKQFILQRTKALIARNLDAGSMFTGYLLRSDPVVSKALQALQSF